MKIGLHGRNFQPDSFTFIQYILDTLQEKGCDIYLSDTLYAYLESHSFLIPRTEQFSLYDDLSSLDLVLSLGGDGTLLDTVTYVGASERPILGVNMGRLGFLASFNKEFFDQDWDRLLTQPLTTEKRSLIRFDSDDEVFAGLNFGLNEFSVLKRDTSSMIRVHASLNGQFLNSYWADGLIVSTPTGSTGYSMSCGGPLILPQSQSFVLTPVSPHNLNVRPMIFPDHETISLEVEGRAKHILVTLDSRSYSVSPDIKIRLSKEKFFVNLVQPENYIFFDTLRHKLNWGMDARN
ncbi:MAG: NAD kinase [Cytophagales bacterium]|nr:NAD kinase [Cytophagales bacterium]